MDNTPRKNKTPGTPRTPRTPSTPQVRQTPRQQLFGTPAQGAPTPVQVRTMQRESARNLYDSERELDLEIAKCNNNVIKANEQLMERSKARTQRQRDEDKEYYDDLMSLSMAEHGFVPSRSGTNQQVDLPPSMVGTTVSVSFRDKFAQVLVTASEANNNPPKKWHRPIVLGDSDWSSISMVGRTVMGCNGATLQPLAGFVPGNLFGFTVAALHDEADPFPLGNIKEWQVLDDQLLATTYDGSVFLYQQQIGGIWGKQVRYFTDEVITAAGFFSSAVVFAITNDLEQKDKAGRMVFANIAEPSVTCNRLDENGVAKVELAEDGGVEHSKMPKIYHAVTVPHVANPYFFGRHADKTENELTMFGIKTLPAPPKDSVQNMKGIPQNKVTSFAVVGEDDHFVTMLTGKIRFSRPSKPECAKWKTVDTRPVDQVRMVAGGPNQAYALGASADGKTLLSIKTNQSGTFFTVQCTDLSPIVKNIGNPVDIVCVSAADGFVAVLLKVELHQEEDSKPPAKKTKTQGEPFDNNNNNADGNEMPGATDTTE